jgi:hypothetical protein
MHTVNKAHLPLNPDNKVLNRSCSAHEGSGVYNEVAKNTLNKAQENAEGQNNPEVI